jgi:hypothetical protein
VELDYARILLGHTELIRTEGKRARRHGQFSWANRDIRRKLMGPTLT